MQCLSKVLGQNNVGDILLSWFGSSCLLKLGRHCTSLIQILT